jgi:hypothetical protein
MAANENLHKLKHFQKVSAFKLKLFQLNLVRILYFHFLIENIVTDTILKAA